MGAEPRVRAPSPGDVEPRAVRRAFARAAATYDQAAALQREVGDCLAARLDVVKLEPKRVVDLGCGTGAALPALAARFPRAELVAIDAAAPMVAAARARDAGSRSIAQRWLGALGGARVARRGWLCADAVALPLAPGSVDVLWSNLMLQWVDDVPRAFAEARRVLAVGGLYTFTTFGPDTLRELARAFAAIDDRTHVSRFVDMHDLGDLLVEAGFAGPVMDMETITVTYPSARALLAELKALGATNRTRGRPRGLTGRGRHARLVAALEALARDGRIPATFEVVYGHAWKAAPRTSADGLPVVAMPASRRAQARP